MKPRRACVIGVLLLSACTTSASTPVGFSPLAPTPAPTPTSQHTLSGIIRVAGLAVSGAKVALLKDNGLTASVVTDGTGTYSFSAVENVSFSGALVSVSKPDYFTDTKYVLMSGDQTLDFDLERSVNVSAGQVIQSPTGDARCASLGYGGMGGALCRRLAVIVPAAGTLEVTVASAPVSPFDVTVLRPDGTIAVYGSSSASPVRVAAAVTGGLTYQIDVVHISATAREFELATTLR